MNFEDYTDTHVLVTGGAGFVGSHLVDRLITLGAKVVVVDNLITGNLENLAEARKTKKLTYIQGDVSKPVGSYLNGKKFDYIFHLASIASPVGFRNYPLETYMANGFGTHYLSHYALMQQARILFASTSEAYGDPLEHPQKETYWGNVNPVGPRSCYDVSKRFGEMVMSTLIREKNLDGRIVRIFNTYGPRMDKDDGRVIPNFIMQALKGDELTIHGDGSQTRSYCYVSDLVEYLLRVMLLSNYPGVVNTGNPEEYTIEQTANMILKTTKSKSKKTYTPRPEDDPSQRKPDISLAISLTDFEPQVVFLDGIRKTIDWFAKKH